MLKLKPVLKNYLWGGTKLKNLYNRDNGENIIAESWEASIHKDGLSQTENGSLKDFIEANGSCLGANCNKFPILIKYIDALQNLSVQVHPAQEYAKKYENDNGKTEMWYIVQADENAGIYCGFKRDTTKEEFLSKLNEGKVEELLNFIPVKKGDCYLIEAGTVHAIGKGCLICEIQQSSNTTYRVYDYNRRDKDGNLRPLHIEKAIEVINFKKFEDKTYSKETQEVDGGKIKTLTECKYFTCRKLELDGKYQEINHSSFVALNILNGQGTINNEAFTSGDSFFVSCGEEIILQGKAEVMLSSASALKCYANVDIENDTVRCGIFDSFGRELICKNAKINTKNDTAIDEIANLIMEVQKEIEIKVELIEVKGLELLSVNKLEKNDKIVQMLESKINAKISTKNNEHWWL